MSGIYLPVWDDDSKSFDIVLRPTKGGVPHITLAWTGKNASHDELKEAAVEAFKHWALQKVTLTEAVVNTFTTGKGVHRNDVLVSIKEEDMVELSREAIRQRFPDVHHKFNMMKPHVTVGIFPTLKEAEQRAAEVNALLPLVVEVVGVTID
jgi:hypothetical protein